MLLLALAAVPSLPVEKLFGDWAVVCDNVKRCEATALMPEDWDGDGDAPELDLSREAGADGAVVLRFSWVPHYAGPVAIEVDGSVVYRGLGKGETIEVRGAPALEIARKLANGHKLVITSEKKQVLARLSLTGASAALRYIDAEQGRTESVTAVVARGAKPSAAIPAATALPRVLAIRPVAGAPTRLDAATIARLRKQADCEQPRASSDMKPNFYTLDPHSTLVAVPCILGAYQASYALFIARDGKVSPARFDILFDKDEPVPSLIEPDWDPKTGILDTHTKGRGLGDCGFNGEWAWDGERFRMTFANGLDTCRLSGNWLTRYRAQPVYR
jgi:hypothetical protein